jgi:hypothetical protein
MRHTPTILALLCASLACATGPASASVSTYLTPEAVATRAPVAVEAVVSGVASGFDPETGSLATYVTLTVTRTHRGPSDLERIVVREAGGTFGDLAHHVDNVPDYVVGEEVFVFLEPGRDGALRTAGAFFGKFTIRQDETARGAMATRDLDGRGTIRGRPTARPESFPLADLAALAASERSSHRSRLRPSRGGPDPATRAAPAARNWTVMPPELERLLWDGDDAAIGGAPTSTFHSTDLGGSSDGTGLPGGGTVPSFTPLPHDDPGRWYEVDSGSPISIDIQRSGNPLGDGAAAAAEMERAMAAWTSVPESRIELKSGDSDARFTTDNRYSPRVSEPPANVILFGDPYDDITDPVDCGGTLAVGGYWTYGVAGSPVNGVGFRRIVKLYVIFNDGFECFLADPDNLAEIAAHELGHGIGLGHSDAADAIMRPLAYGARGPRLGDDDGDAAHCVYPHDLHVEFPKGGEVVEAGGTYQVAWASTTETGPDPGTVSVEYSADGGSTWTVAEEGEPNDGACDWLVPDETGDDYRLRIIRHNRLGASSPFPEACSLDESDESFTVVEPDSTPSTLPAGLVLRVSRAGDETVELSWSAICPGIADDYAVYEGSLSALRIGIWNHAAVTCAAGTDGSETVPVRYYRSYFLVVPMWNGAEGDLGTDGSGSPRPEPLSACGVRQDPRPCP